MNICLIIYSVYLFLFFLFFFFYLSILTEIEKTLVAVERRQRLQWYPEEGGRGRCFRDGSYARTNANQREPIRMNAKEQGAPITLLLFFSLFRSFSPFLLTAVLRFTARVSSPPPTVAPLTTQHDFKEATERASDSKDWIFQLRLDITDICANE